PHQPTAAACAPLLRRRGPHGLDLSDRRRTLRGRFRRVWLLRISPHRRRRRRQWCSARRHSSRFFEPFVIEGNFVRCPTGRRAGAPRLHEIGLAGEAVGGDVFMEVPGGGDAYFSSMSFTIGTTIVRLQFAELPQGHERFGQAAHYRGGLSASRRSIRFEPRGGRQRLQHVGVHGRPAGLPPCRLPSEHWQRPEAACTSKPTAPWKVANHSASSFLYTSTPLCASGGA